jgi:AraC family transcriptional regulator
VERAACIASAALYGDPAAPGGSVAGESDGCGARAFLEEHHAEPVTLSQLAGEVGLSPFHLVRVFQRAVGAPPHVYLESVRIRRAQELIAGGAPLGDVAYAVGYSSQSHFTTRFRQIIGVTSAATALRTPQDSERHRAPCSATTSSCAGDD